MKYVLDQVVIRKRVCMCTLPKVALLWQLYHRSLHAKSKNTYFNKF